MYLQQGDAGKGDLQIDNQNAVGKELDFSNHELTYSPEFLESIGVKAVVVVQDPVVGNASGSFQAYQMTLEPMPPIQVASSMLTFGTGYSTSTGWTPCTVWHSTSISRDYMASMTPLFPGQTPTGRLRAAI